MTKRPHRMLVSVDCAVFGLDDDELKVLLVQRKLAPFAGKWALPGGFVGDDESLEDAARRELRDETGVEDIYLEQLYTFGAPDRDPRERVISVAYYALVNLFGHSLHASSDADDAAWFSLQDLPTLGFDHPAILEYALERLRNKLHYEPVGFELLPKKFTLTMLQQLYEKVWDVELDKRNFRKKILSTNVLDELDEVERDVAHRAARLYRFNPRRHEALKRKGILFAV